VSVHTIMYYITENGSKIAILISMPPCEYYDDNMEIQKGG